MNTNKKGARLEREVMKIFEDAGWETVRASASKGSFGGYKPDLIATKRTQRADRKVWLVLAQCKMAKA